MIDYNLNCVQYKSFLPKVASCLSNKKSNTEMPLIFKMVTYNPKKVFHAYWKVILPCYFNVRFINLTHSILTVKQSLTSATKSQNGKLRKEGRESKHAKVLHQNQNDKGHSCLNDQGKPCWLITFLDLCTCHYYLIINLSLVKSTSHWKTELVTWIQRLCSGNPN